MAVSDQQHSQQKKGNKNRVPAVNVVQSSQNGDPASVDPDTWVRQVPLREIRRMQLRSRSVPELRAVAKYLFKSLRPQLDSKEFATFFLHKNREKLHFPLPICRSSLAGLDERVVAWSDQIEDFAGVRVMEKWRKKFSPSPGRQVTNVSATQAQDASLETVTVVATGDSPDAPRSDAEAEVRESSDELPPDAFNTFVRLAGARAGSTQGDGVYHVSCAKHSLGGWSSCSNPYAPLAEAGPLDDSEDTDSSLDFGLGRVRPSVRIA